jgi:hypothetical protein
LEGIYNFIIKAEVAKLVYYAPGIPIRWIDKSKEPEESRKRGNIKGCAVNTKPIKSFVLDKEDFQKEVTEALK